MKKTLLLFIIAILVASSVSALEFKIGPKVAIGEYSYRGPDWSSYKDSTGDKDLLSISVAGGAFANLQLSSLIGIQVEGLFTMASFRYGDNSTWGQDTIYELSFPVYARFDFDIADFGIFFLAGPRFDILFDQFMYKDDTGSSSSGSLTDDYGFESLFVIGVGVGGGVSVPAGPGSLDFGVVFNTGITNVDQDVDYYPYGIEAQIAYGFGF